METQGTLLRRTACHLHLQTHFFIFVTHSRLIIFTCIILELAMDSFAAFTRLGG